LKTILFAAAASFFLTTFAFAEEHNPISSILTGNPIYQKNCVGCHGKTARGGRFRAGPPLVSDKVAAASSEELRAFITNGKGRMPKFGDKISVSDIDALVEQIRTANTK
jgi:cytochrome c551